MKQQVGIAMGVDPLGEAVLLGVARRILWRRLELVPSGRDSIARVDLQHEFVYINQMYFDARPSVDLLRESM